MRGRATWTAGAAVVLAGAAVALLGWTLALLGWTLAGPPGAGAAIPVPPPCPPSALAVAAFGLDGGGSPRQGADRLPVPIGPLAARVCRYGPAASSGAGVTSSELLDPMRAATLAGDLDEPLLDQAPLPIVVRSPAPAPPPCATTTPARTLVVFAFHEDPSVTVAVGPPGCPYARNGTLTTTARPDLVARLTTP